MASAPRILYETPRLRVVYQPANSNWLAFSFNGGEFNEIGTRFFGDTYFAKRNVAAIGFVDLHSRWFPRDDMIAALEVIRREVPAGTYERSVTYGASMGAWGALKYSRMLGAHASLAFGPQWSINPALVGDFDDRYQRWFQPKYHIGMEVGADDLCPNNYVFFDPLFPPDLRHAEHIAQHPNVHRIMHTFMGHPGIGYYTQTRLVDQMFALARQDAPDLREFRRLIRSKRAQSSIYWLGRADCLKRKRGIYHLNWLLRSYELAQEVTDAPMESSDAIEPLVLLTKVLLDAGYREQAIANVSLIWTKVLAGAAHPDLSHLFVRLGSLDRARAVAEQAVRRKPNSLDVRLELARTLIATGDLQRANAEVDIVRARAQERPIVWFRLKILYQRLGRPDDVAAADEMLARLPPMTKNRNPAAVVRPPRPEPIRPGGAGPKKSGAGKRPGLPGTEAAPLRLVP